MHTLKEKGFTLVELSIVIVIIGLIVAGVVGGQSLIRQAQLRSVITEQGAVKTAVKAFRVEYNAIPGDFDKAFAFWAGCASGDAADCNGDGNHVVSIVPVTDATDNEAYHFWEHLNLASMFPGAFTGLAIGANDNGGDRGVNLPASKYPGVSISYFAPAGTRNHNIYFGGDVVDGLSQGDVFLPSEASSIDTKLDDGEPGNGQMQATGSTPANCFSSATAYNVAQTVATCYIWVQD